MQTIAIRGVFLLLGGMHSAFYPPAEPVKILSGMGQPANCWVRLISADRRKAMCALTPLAGALLFRTLRFYLRARSNAAGGRWGATGVARILLHESGG